MGERTLPIHDGMTYQSLVRRFEWSIPERFNMGVSCSDDQHADAPALRAIDANDVATTLTFGDLADLSDRLAGQLGRLGVGRGDRIGLVLPQSAETGLMHLAIWKLGAISLPLASLFGPDALEYRLSDSESRLVITSEANRAKVDEARGEIEVLQVGAPLEALMEELPIGEPVETESDAPAYLIYTSGTTGPPKGALHAHRSLFGHLPGFESYYEFAPQPGDLIWTPADWAWIGGLMDVLVPAWYFGMEVLTADHDFDPEWAADLMAEHRVTLAFLPPTALKMMRAAGVSRSDLALRAIFTGGEPLGEEMLRWAESELGAAINEGYGQTECNLVVGNCGSTWPVRPGSMGRSLPGHEVVVLDEAGNRLIGEEGEISVKAPDPVMMLRYWNRPDDTEEKYRDGWLLTGDLGVEDEDGYLWFRSRKDDVILSMGYRIGPGEIEESLMGHPAVAMCAVVGITDEIRGQVPAAFVVLREGVDRGDALAAELQNHVRTRLAGHEVPRRIYFVDDLPRTTTGKIMRRALRAQ
jgi:acetyl-CoA synthetase